MTDIPDVNIVQLFPWQAPGIMRDPLAFLQQQAAQHGDFIQYPLNVMTVYHISNPAIIQHVLQTNSKNYSKDTVQYNTLAQITGNGLLTSDGRSWLTHRRLMQPAFHRSRLEQFGETIVNATAAMLDRWQTHAASGTPIDVDAEMMQVTLEIVGKTLFNIDLRADAPEMTHAVLDMLAYVVYRAQNPLALPLSVPTARNRRLQAAMAKLDHIIHKAIAFRRASDTSNDQGDMLSMLLAARDEESGQGLSDDEIRDEMITLLIAGHETVASALTWGWYLLSLHPTVRTRMEAEVDGVLNGRFPTPADLDQLPFTRQIFDETLRLYPPAWLITRRALADDEIGRHTIPARSILILSPYVTHRHPAYWPNPLGFDPERFETAVHKERPRYAYIPFGGGPRLCIGDRFALLEAPLIMAVICPTLPPQPAPQPPRHHGSPSSRCVRHGMLMRVEARYEWGYCVLRIA
ncbi:MAG: cytochrome P450 [Chloroflexota bacterium]